jgi:hypothetical protein
MPRLSGPDNHLYRHGHTRAREGKWSSLYIRFMNLKARCHQPCDKDYVRYGAKGITVCDRWRFGEGGRTGFECFLADMGEPPFEKASIDRIDSSKGYSPENCRWADAKQQGNNRRTNRWIDLDGQRKTVAQWSEISGVGPKTILYRINRGIDPQTAIFETPSRHRHFKKDI